MNFQFLSHKWVEKGFYSGNVFYQFLNLINVHDSTFFSTFPTFKAFFFVLFFKRKLKKPQNPTFQAPFHETSNGISPIIKLISAGQYLLSTCLGIQVDGLLRLKVLVDCIAWKFAQNTQIDYSVANAYLLATFRVVTPAGIVCVCVTLVSLGQRGMGARFFFLCSTFFVVVACLLAARLTRSRSTRRSSTRCSHRLLKPSDLRAHRFEPVKTHTRFFFYSYNRYHYLITITTML